MNIVVTGSTGLIGTALVSRLEADGHTVTRLVRRSPRTGQNEIQWNPAAQDEKILLPDDVDAVIHLAGESVAGRWTPAKKELIHDSRINVTQHLSRELAALPKPPRVLLSASAIGYYGDRGNEVLNEKSAPGTGFLPDICRAWEAATQPAEKAGIRVAHLRFGVVLSPEGGALSKMVGPFRMGVGGHFGNGRQFWSWITLEDAVNVILHTLKTESLSGPVNIVAPQPVTSRELSHTLAKVLHRPAMLPVPAMVLHLALGQMADEALLSSTRVEPQKLKNTGYAFRHTFVVDALRSMLGA